MNLQAPLNRFITNAVCVSIALLPFTANLVYADDLNQSAKSKEVRDLLNETNFDYQLSNDSVSVTFGDSKSSVSENDFTDTTNESKKSAMADGKEYSETAKSFDKSDITEAVNFGTSLKSVYANDSGDDNGKLGTTSVIYQSAALKAEAGTINLKNDHIFDNIKEYGNKNINSSLINIFSDACDDETTVTEKTQSQFIATEERCLQYKDTSTSCVISHDYDITVIEPVWGEHFNLGECSCDKSDTECSSDSIKGCVAFWIGQIGDNYLGKGNKNTCTVYLDKTKFWVREPQSITRAYLNGLKWDDIIAVYIWEIDDTKANEGFDQARPIYKSRGNLPADNFNDICDLLGRTACPDHSTHLVNDLDSDGNVILDEQGNVKQHVENIVRKDFVTGAEIPNARCEFSSSEEQKPNIDVTNYIKNIPQDSQMGIAIAVSVGGRGEGYARFSVEYDASKALKETFEPQSCINTANALDLTSKTSTGKIYCASMPNSDAILRGEEVCMKLSNGHTLCPSAFQNSPIPSGYEYNVESGQMELTKINPLCTSIKVSTNTILSNSEDYLNSSCKRLIEEKSKEGKTCSQKKVVCRQTTAEAEELESDKAFDITEESNASSIYSDCYLKEYTYSCGKYEDVPIKETVKSKDCLNNLLSCANGECISPDEEKTFTEDLAKTSALLQAVEFMAQDLHCDDSDDQSSDVVCRVFQGTNQSCHIFNTGATYQNCCANMSNVTVGSYISALLNMGTKTTSSGIIGKGLDKLDPSNITSKTLSKSFSVTETAHSKALNSINNITGIDGSAELAENVAATALLIAYKKALENAISELMKTIGSSLINGMASAAETVGAEAIAKKMKDEAMKQAEQEASSSLASAAGSAVTIIGLVYTIYTCIDTALKMVFKCKTQDFETSSNKALKKCTFLYDKCVMKVPSALAGKSCYDRRYYFCCYSSPLARIIMEQVRKTNQLGRFEGDRNCSGITVDEVAKLDWDKIDLSEWTALILEAGNATIDDDAYKRTQELLDNMISAPSDDDALLNDLGTNDEIGQLVTYFQDRNAVDDNGNAVYPNLVSEWNNLDDSVREKIELREKQNLEIITNNENNSNLTDKEKQELDKLHNSTIENGTDFSDEKVSGVDVSKKSEIEQVIHTTQILATQAGVPLTEITKWSDYEVALGIINYQIFVKEDNYTVIVREFKEGDTKLTDNVKSVVKLARGYYGSSKVPSKPLGVKTLTGEDSMLNINASSKNVTYTNGEANLNCDESTDCARPNAIERIENVVETVSEKYGTVNDLGSEAREATPLDIGGMGFSSEKNGTENQTEE